MTKFKKKPVEVEAYQWVDNLNEILEFVGGDAFYTETLSGDGNICIPTLEGRMYANKGDWIIRGIKGEFYPCKPDIFEATYEQIAKEADGRA